MAAFAVVQPPLPDASGPRCSGRQLCVQGDSQKSAARDPAQIGRQLHRCRAASRVSSKGSEDLRIPDDLLSSRARPLDTLSSAGYCWHSFRDACLPCTPGNKVDCGCRAYRVRSVKMTGLRRLIINADDYGRSRGINLAIEQLAAANRLGGISVLANGEYFEEAADFLRSHPWLSVGVHFNAVEGKPLAAQAQISILTDRQGNL